MFDITTQIYKIAIDTTFEFFPICFSGTCRTTLLNIIEML